MTCTYGKTYKVPMKNLFTRDFYTFDGWSKYSTPGADTIGYNFKNLSDKDGDTVYLYAKWRTDTKLLENPVMPQECKAYDKNGNKTSEVKLSFCAQTVEQDAGGSYTVTLYLQGQKTYESAANSPIAFHYAVYNVTGRKMYEDDKIIKDFKVGETFNRQLWLTDLPLGEYRIVFSDYHEK
jgi:hypothetical protein